MARPRSTIYVAIGAAAFIVAAGLVFLVLRSNDNGSNKASVSTTTTTAAPVGPTQAGTGAGVAAATTALPIPEGKQAVAVKIPAIEAVAGFVHQGDMVNVFGAFKDKPVNNLAPPSAKLILSNIQVLSVTGGAAGADAVFLLAVDADQAERVIYLTSFQSIYLTLVPKNGSPSSTGGRNATNIL